jgi:hypothetical protein
VFGPSCRSSTRMPLGNPRSDIAHRTLAGAKAANPLASCRISSLVMTIVWIVEPKATSTSPWDAPSTNSATCQGWIGCGGRGVPGPTSFCRAVAGPGHTRQPSVHWNTALTHLQHIILSSRANPGVYPACYLEQQSLPGRCTPAATGPMRRAPVKHLVSAPGGLQGVSAAQSETC